MSSNSGSFGIIYPPIDDLLGQIAEVDGSLDENDKGKSIANKHTGSKFALAQYGATRARQLVSFFSDLDAGIHSNTTENVGPLVDYYATEKPLSIAMREIYENRLNLDMQKKDEVTQESVDIDILDTSSES